MKVLLVTLLLTTSAWAGLKGDLRDGDKALEEGRQAAAMRAYEKALEQHPNNSTVLLRIARLHIAGGNPGAALAPSRVARAANEPGADEVLAHALLATGAVDEAAAIATQALSLGPNPQLSLVLGEAALSQKQFDKATEQLGLAASGGLLRAQVGQAYALARAGEFDTARIHASELQLRHPDDPMVLSGVTVVFNLIGEHPSAQAASEQAQMAASNHSSSRALADAWLTQAAQRHDRGDTEGALWLGLPAQALSPNGGHLSWVLGSWWLQTQEYLRAASQLDRALGQSPYAVKDQTHGVVVMTTEQLSRTQKASARQQISLSLAYCHEQLGDRRAEAKALQIAIDTMEEPNSMALLRLSKSYEATGQYSLSAQASLDSAQADPSNSEAHFRVAQGYGAAGGIDLAIRYGVQAWKTDSGNPETALLLADLFMQRREPRQALEILNVAIDSNPRRKDLVEARNQIAQSATLPF